MQDWHQEWKSLKISMKKNPDKTNFSFSSGREKARPVASIQHKCYKNLHVRMIRENITHPNTLLHTHTHTFFDFPFLLDWFPTGRVTLMLITYLPLFIQQFCSLAQESSIALFQPQM